MVAADTVAANVVFAGAVLAVVAALVKEVATVAVVAEVVVVAVAVGLMSYWLWWQ